jgi:hypothetical protein
MEDPLSIAKLCVSAENKEDINTIKDLLAGDILYEQKPPGIQIKGKEQVITMLEQDITCGHKRSIIGQPEVDGDRVTIRAEVSGDDFEILGIDHITATYKLTVHEGMVDSIIVLVDEDDWALVEEKTGGGLGVNIEFVKQGIRIKGFADQSPAEEAGMQLGDIISGIEGISCDTMESWEMVYRLRGPVGSKVNLTVIRENVDETMDIVVTRIKLD